VRPGLVLADGHLVRERHDADELRRIRGGRGQDREPLVERRGVGGDDDGAEALAQHGGDGGLSGGCRAEQPEDE
jgi:hypothetical protein